MHPREGANRNRDIVEGDFFSSPDNPHVDPIALDAMDHHLLRQTDQQRFLLDPGKDGGRPEGRELLAQGAYLG